MPWPGEKAKKFFYCPMIDARRMEVYTAIYDREGNVVRDIHAEVIEENSFADLLSTRKVLFFGNGSDKGERSLETSKCRVH